MWRMSAALKLIQTPGDLSEKPLLGEKRPKPRLVWENQRLSAGTPKEKSKARLRVVSGQSVYAYVGGNPVNYSDPSGTFCVPCAVWGGRMLVAGGRAAAPHIARGAAAAYNSAKTFLYTNPVTTALVGNPVIYTNTMDAINSLATEGPPYPSVGGYIGAIPNAYEKLRIFLTAQSGDGTSSSQPTGASTSQPTQAPLPTSSFSGK